MQIRVGNKQDEPSIRELAAECAQESGMELNLSGPDNDLQNIEKHYFGANGVFFVAAEDKQVVALLGARMKSEATLELCRLSVSESWRRRGIGRRLMRMLNAFAQQMDYQAVEVSLSTICTPLSHFFSSLGFRQEQSSSEGLLLRLTVFQQIDQQSKH